jgi:hypothetical protein
LADVGFKLFLEDKHIGGKQMKTAIEKLNDVTAIATDPGNAGANDYLRGMANGLILAKSIFDGVEPEYIISVDPDDTVHKMVGISPLAS